MNINDATSEFCSKLVIKRADKDTPWLILHTDGYYYEYNTYADNWHDSDFRYYFTHEDLQADDWVVRGKFAPYSWPSRE